MNLQTLSRYFRLTATDLLVGNFNLELLIFIFSELGVVPASVETFEVPGTASAAMETILIVTVSKPSYICFVAMKTA